MEAAMRFLTAAAVVAVLAGPAYGQSIPPVTLPMGGDKPQRPTDPAKERDYRSALGGLPDKKAADPWGNIRQNAPAPPAKKATAPAAKNGTPEKKTN
jgi:hypothetical protein